MNADQEWLHPFATTTNTATTRPPGATPRARLVCLPHAGGSPSFFRDWPRHLDPEIELSAVCYPGRQTRFADPVITDMRVMADRLAAVLATGSDLPLWLFGHSMGALLAYETALTLREGFGRPVAGLLVSGAVPPHRNESRGIHTRGDEAIVADVLDMGAAESELLADPEFRAFLLPAFRADYELIETYRPTPGAAPLDAPLTACFGTEDEDARRWVDEWRAYGSGPTAVVSYPGDHFYLQDAAPDLVPDLSRRILAPRPA
ncbi:thioesterase II family protein [Streptomyces sp. NPDC102283]|uniref:thioesterase II family protein n=1 Tax=Streptomyces sp. NPDC102283 TaxID=3366155 RepID=UPI003802CCDF